MAETINPFHLLATAIQSLESAKTDYQVKKAALDCASSEESGALNRLNKAQKEFDAAVKAVKDKSEYRSDWATKRTNAMEK